MKVNLNLMKREFLMKALFNKKSLSTMFFTGLYFAIANPASAQLAKAKGVLETFQSELTTIIPIAAAVILLCLAIGYAGKFIEKDTFVRWGIGVVIGGSAVQITTMLFT